MTFRVSGSVLEDETERPLAGMLVRLYDKDVVLDDFHGVIASSTPLRSVGPGRTETTIRSPQQRGGAALAGPIRFV
jgi:hypothetical protein